MTSEAGDRFEAWLQSRTRLAALVVVLVAASYRAVHIAAWQESPYGAHPIVDAEAYDERALRIASGEWLGDRIFYQDPLYPYLLAVVYTAVGHRPTVVVAAQVLAGSLLPVLVALLGLRAFRVSRRRNLIAWGGASLAALSPHLAFYNGLLLKTSLEVFLTTVHLVLLAVAGDAVAIGRRALLLVVAAGSLLGLNLLCRGNYVLLVPFFTLWLIWRIPRGTSRRRALVTAAAYVGAATVMLSPVTIRNRIVGGEWVLVTSQGGQNFYIGANERAQGVYAGGFLGVRMHPRYEELDFHALAVADTGREMSATEVSRHFFSKGLRWMATHPGAALALQLRKCSLWLMGPDVPDNYDLSFVARRFSPALLLPIPTPWTFGVLGWAGVGLVLFAGRRRSSLERAGQPTLVLVAGFVVAYSAAMLLFFVADRYRLPLFPCLQLLAAGVLGVLFFEFSTLRRRARGVVVAALAVATVLVYRPWIDPRYAEWVKRDDGVEIAKLAAIESIDDPDGSDRVLQLLREARRAAPTNPVVAVALARFLRGQSGGMREAEGLYREAISARPGDAYARTELGTLLAAESRPDEAREEIEAVVAQRPQLLDPWLALGRVNAIAGARSAAREAYGRFVVLALDYPADRLVELQEAGLALLTTCGEAESVRLGLESLRAADPGRLGASPDWLRVALKLSLTPAQQEGVRRFMAERRQDPALGTPAAVDLLRRVQSAHEPAL